jgi:hypothetical protein
MPISREKRIEKYKNKKDLGLCTWGGCLNLVEPGYISNFQWVYNDEELDINWMKGKLSHNEFKEAVRIIYNSLFLE